MRATPVPEEVRSLLVVRLDRLGDWILTSAFLRELRAHYPNARVTAIVNAAVEALAVTCPYLDECILYPIKPALPPFDQLSAWRRARAFSATLAHRKFDMAIMPRWDLDEFCALAIPYFLKVPVRVSFGQRASPFKAIKNSGYDRLLTHIVPSEGDVHEVSRSFAVLRYLGVAVASDRLEVWPTKIERDKIDRFLRASFPSTKFRRLIAIAPGASLARKRWPSDKFGKVAARLIQDFAAGVLVLGGPEERAVVAEVLASVAQTDRIADLVGQLSLREVFVVLEHCQLLISNDSALAHMAAAAATPVVMISSQPSQGHLLYGHPPERFHPWSVPYRVLRPALGRHPCTDRCNSPVSHCIDEVSVAEVVSAATTLLHPTADRQMTS